MKIEKIIVIFKTHLDIGFTDFSADVTKKYLDFYIPNAIETAKILKASNTGARFVWTTGSWLINEYLQTKSAGECSVLEEAIANGDICWHGLPFTTHTELMSAELFDYGLSISQRLDKRFGKKTAAAKMTDVPGHTKAIIRRMKNAGTEFLHIGVNKASTPPEVPPLFRWRNDSGEEITVMYQGDYGEFSEIGNTGTAVCFAHTHDNTGAQSVEEIINLYEGLARKFPDAEIAAGNLNDLAAEVKKIKAALPVVTDEIGDTWIHGVGTDPKKVSCFKGLERFWKTLESPTDRETLAKGLIMIPEHTWGLDEKITLSDKTSYSGECFKKARENPDFKRMEKSWNEQRNYLYNAVEKLTAENRKTAEKILAEASRNPADTAKLKKAAPEDTISLGSFEIKFNPTGEICLLKKGNIIIADENNRLCSLLYERFGSEDYDRFYGQYIRRDYDWSDAGFDWAKEDFTKPGLENAIKKHISYLPECEGIYCDENKIIVKYVFPAEAYESGGCPKHYDLEITAEGQKLQFDIAWFGKNANRGAEAIWFGFNPAAHNMKISKLGQHIDPKKVVKNGQRSLHATDFGIVYDEIILQTYDAALVAPGKPSLLNFANEPVCSGETSAFFNLYNNVWGTNFPMWYDENARFRFVMDFKIA